MGGIFFSLKRLDYSDKACFLLPISGLLITLGIGLAFRGVPALPFIAAPVIIYLFSKRKKFSLSN